MATSDHTSKRRGSRRNQQQMSAARTGAVLVPAADIMPPMREAHTLEEAIESVRTLMMQVRSVLHCLSDVLTYTDDDDAVMHAEVARSAAGWANLAAAELDLVKLRPWIDAIKRDGGGASGEGGAGAIEQGLYQVRESSPVYLV